MYLLLYCLVRNGFEAGKIHNEGHWKGWALEIETFLGPEMATSELMGMTPQAILLSSICKVSTCHTERTTREIKVR